MRVLIIIGILFSLCSGLEGKAQNWDTFDKHSRLIDSQGVINKNLCGIDGDLVLNFRETLYNITLHMYKKLTTVSNSNFVFSPFSLWQALAAIAEGASGQAREELFNFLLLPHDECIRRSFYQLASTLDPPGEDVKLLRSTRLILDDGSHMNNLWHKFVHNNFLLKTSTVPLKSDPVGTADLVRKFASLQLPSPNFKGHSILIDTLDFKGLWTDAFSDAIVERAPFFDDFGKKIGYVDLMKMKTRLKMAYIPSVNLKILELPMGFGGRYRMLFGLNIGPTDLSLNVPEIMENIVFEIEENLKESIIPLEVAIPRFRMTTEYDMRTILEDMGVRALWNDVEGTKNISEPSALPSMFVHRTTVTFDTTGVRAPIQEVRNFVPGYLKSSDFTDVETGLDAILGKDFIADKPVLYGLMDSKTYTCLIASFFSKPTYEI